jgi:hypothetical protein
MPWVEATLTPQGGLRGEPSDWSPTAHGDYADVPYGGAPTVAAVDGNRRSAGMSKIFSPAAPNSPRHRRPQPP